VELIAFYIMAAIVTISAVCVIAAKNPVHSVLWLILTFFTSAGLMVLIGAEFLAMLLVVVYVGAVAVLFLFVVMMLDVDFAEMKSGALEYAPMGALVGIILAAELIIVLAGNAFHPAVAGSGASPIPAPSERTNTQALGDVLYTDYIFYFQIAGMVLLVAMIGAIVLTLRHREQIGRASCRERVLDGV